MQYGQKNPTKSTALDTSNIYRSIADLPLYNFDQYRKTLNNSWFVVGYDGRQKAVNPDLIKPVEDFVNEEYYARIQDRSFAIFIGKLAKIEAFKMKYYAASTLVERMAKGFGNDVQQQMVRKQYIDELRKYGFKMEFMANVEEDLAALSIISTQIQSYKTQIELIKDELRKIGNKESLSLGRQLKIVSQALQLGYLINAKKITVLDWIEYTEQMEDLSAKN